MLSNRKTTYTSTVDVDSNAMGCVLGKWSQNLNNLKTTYPDVKIWTSQNGPLTTFNLSSNNVNKLEQCQTALEKLKYNGEAIHHSIMQRKRVTKNIEVQRQSIIAGQKIRETLENEMRTKHRDEVQRKIISNLQKEPMIIANTNSNPNSNSNSEQKNELESIATTVSVKNMFGSLEIE